MGEADEGVNWIGFWALARALGRRSPMARGKLALSRMGDRVAVAYANYGAGRRLQDLESPLRRLAVAHCVRGKANVVAEELPRFAGPNPTIRVAREDVDMMAPDDGPQSWEDSFRCPTKSAQEGGLSPGLLGRFPLAALADAVVNRPVGARKAGGYGEAFCLSPTPPSRGWASRAK